jgi:phenylacetate-CoA ligase
METLTPQQRRDFERAPRSQLQAHQLRRLNDMLPTLVTHNRFYSEKLAGVRLPLSSLEELSSLPCTFKEELATAPWAGEFAANLTWPLEQYVRFHRTSGTRGKPLIVLDTAEDWQWWLHCWQFILDAAEIGPEDRIVLAFSFGPFIGFWSAFEAAAARGALVVPTGGLTSLARLEMIRVTRATALFSTPSYALRLAEVAEQHQIPLHSLEVRRIVVAGEPGGSVPAIRRKIESAWNARLIDHAGGSEIGPWGYADAEGRGLHVLESEFIAEFRSVEHGGPAAAGELSELIITSLGRIGSPVIRYRTGDLVRPVWDHPLANRFVLFEGGILGRADDMLIVRGVNVFPTALEQILRSFPEVVEYRVRVFKEGAMDAIGIEVEDRLAQPERIAKEIHVRLGLRTDVKCAPLGSLPRFEGKGKRIVDER